MCNITLPSKAEIESYARRFWIEHACFEAELHDLFSQPATRDIVEQRVRRLNAIYHARVSRRDQSVLADRILKLDIDAEVKEACINSKLVSQVAKIGDGLERNRLSFVTKYFSFCNPDVYPLFDNNVMRFLWKMNESFHFDDNFYQTEVYAIRRNVDYARFIEIWSAFRNLSDDLRSVSVNDLDKYMWIKGSN